MTEQQLTAMRQALEFCEFAWRDVPMNDYAFEQLEKAITALRQALEQQPEDQAAKHWHDLYLAKCQELHDERARLGAQIEALEQQPADEPVATDWERIARVQDAKLRAMCGESGGFEKLCEVMDRYEARPQPAAQWVELTDEEAEELRIAEEFDQWGLTEGAFKYAARAIEAKLREKNSSIQKEN